MHHFFLSTRSPFLDEKTDFPFDIFPPPRIFLSIFYTCLIQRKMASASCIVGILSVYQGNLIYVYQKICTVLRFYLDFMYR
jgi:hypothetical protein